MTKSGISEDQSLEKKVFPITLELLRMLSEFSHGINYLVNQIKKLRNISKNGLVLLISKVKISKEITKLGSNHSELFIKIYMNS